MLTHRDVAGGTSNVVEKQKEGGTSAFTEMHVEGLVLNTVRVLSKPCPSAVDPAQDADCGLATQHTGHVFHGCHTPSATLLHQWAPSKVLAQNEKQSVMKTHGR